MRTNDDETMANACAESGVEIDMIFGGHDHTSQGKMLGRTCFIKSASDFREITRIRLGPEAGYDGYGGLKYSWDKIGIAPTLTPDPTVASVVDRYVREMEADPTMHEPLIHFPESYNARFETVRSSETEFGNFLADIVREATHSDVAII
jgi:2',3'-cyclic-nucleotide 2'-phosphodiesterase (5'-nucleotidase family)